MAGEILRPLRPTLGFDPERLLKAQGIAAAIFDVDGVLTDGRIYIGEQGETVKAFSTLDGHGLKLLAQAGIEPVVLTGRDSPASLPRPASSARSPARPWPRSMRRATSSSSRA